MKAFVFPLLAMTLFLSVQKIVSAQVASDTISPEKDQPGKCIKIPDRTSPFLPAADPGKFKGNQYFPCKWIFEYKELQNEEANIEGIIYVRDDYYVFLFYYRPLSENLESVKVIQSVDFNKDGNLDMLAISAAHKDTMLYLNSLTIPVQGKNHEERMIIFYSGDEYLKEINKFRKLNHLPNTNANIPENEIGIVQNFENDIYNATFTKTGNEHIKIYFDTLNILFKTDLNLIPGIHLKTSDQARQTTSRQTYFDITRELSSLSLNEDIYILQ